LHCNASQCRNLADTAITPEARDILLDLAHDYDDRAATLQASDTKSLFLLEPPTLLVLDLGRKQASAR
jgi:hypothetical protein